MSARRIRIYKGLDAESLVIGWSASAFETPDDPKFADFMTTRGYQCRDIEEYPGSYSARHTEVRPPLSEIHIKEFGTLCVGGYLDGQRISGIVDPYHDGTNVLDNRKQMPQRPLDSDAPLIITSS